MKLGLVNLMLIPLFMLSVQNTFGQEDSKEMVYSDMEEQQRHHKKEVSDAFWNNPLDTRRCCFLLV